ncbi:MAG: DUF2797 domain-containing protein [Bacteroidota bacterium]|nr:DUF2797 domain-containing protein [Bacteroidota bacterium]
MRLNGPLSKMISVAEDPIKYYLEVGEDFLVVNDLIGQRVALEYQHQIQCFCGKVVTEVFRMNFCRDCFFNRPEAGDFIFRPELSKAHLDQEDRDLEWEKKHQLQPHVVYLANSAGLKVGVTRKAQVPTRWIDQGASEAVILAEVENRYLAGISEVALKEYVSDKTPWQRMVKGEEPEIDLLAEKERLSEFLPKETKEQVSTDDRIYQFRYPVRNYPTKAKSLNFQKADRFEGKLIGIRGQYLLFEEGVVFNVRSHEGYYTELRV